MQFSHKAPKIRKTSLPMFVYVTSSLLTLAKTNNRKRVKRYSLSASSPNRIRVLSYDSGCKLAQICCDLYFLWRNGGHVGVGDIY